MIAVFVLYLLVLMVIVYYSSKRSKTNEDYVIGGKKISGFSLALSERATGESAWLLLGLTGHAYAEGWAAIWVAVGCVLGILFLWYVMATPLQRFAEETKALTVPGLLSFRFPGSEKKIGTISSVIIIFFFILYIAAQFSGAGKIFHDTFGIDPFWGMVIGSLLVTVYTMLGGFITVVATDAFQAVLMVITCVVLPIVAFFVYAEHNPAGMDAFSLRVETFPTDYSAAGWLFILNGLSWAFGYTGQPQLLTRMMAMRNRKETIQARWVAVFWTMLAYGGAFMIGIIGYRLVEMGFIGDAAAELAQDSEKILPVMVVTLLNPILAGILLSGAVSAMMSTASSQLMVASSAISEDMFANLNRQAVSEKKMLRINKWLTLLVGLFAFILAISMEDTVYGLVSYAWSGIGAAFGPAILLMLFWKKFSRHGVYASLIVGTVSAVLWKTFFVDYTDISERLASFVIAFIAAVVFSIVYPEQKKL